MKTVTIYQNKRNAHKYIEVKRYADGHYYWGQFMLFDNGVINPVGSKHRRFVRVSKKTMLSVIADYNKLDTVISA